MNNETTIALADPVGDKPDKPYQVLELFPLFRRLTTAQRAAIAVDALPLFEEEARKLAAAGKGRPKRLQQELVGAKLDISASTVHRAELIKARDLDVFYDMKAGTISMEDARRKVGTWEPTSARRDDPDHIHQSTAERQGRAKRIKALADEGHMATQIAKIAGLHVATVRRIANDYGIDLPDGGRPRRLFDVTRCANEAVLQAAQIRTFLDLIRGHAEKLDHAQIPDWVAHLKDSRRAISELITLLTEEGDTYEKDNNHT